MSYKIKNVNFTMKSVKINLLPFLVSLLCWYLSSYCLIQCTHSYLQGLEYVLGVTLRRKQTESLSSQSLHSGRRQQITMPYNLSVRGVEIMGQGS